MKLTPSIRQAVESDGEFLARAEAEIARAPGLLVQAPGEIPARAYAAKIAALRREGRYIVAESGGRIVGHAFLDPMELRANRHVLRLTIAVHDGCQGRGVGTALMNDLLLWARADGRVGKIELLVRAVNSRAISLYRRLGFIEEGRLRNRVKLPSGEYADDIAMAWFPGSKPVLSVRGIEPEDALSINRYWAENTDDDLVRLGEAARPDPRENIEFINQLCARRPPPERAEEGILLWMMDGKSIGYSTLKEIRFGQDAQTHLHLWEKTLRGKGVGAVLFCLSALRFIKDFRLERLYCQPKHDNPMPNGMLKKIGFSLLGTVDWKQTGNGSSVKQNRYLIDESISRGYLDSVQGRFRFETPS